MYNLNDRELEKATVESPEGDDLSKDPHDSNRCRLIASCIPPLYHKWFKMEFPSPLSTL